MNKGFVRLPADYCPNCKARTLMAYDNRGKCIHYVAKNPAATTDSIMEKINNTTIQDMVCSKCGKHFLIDYSLGYPRAIEKFGLYVSFFDNYLNHNR